MVASKTGKFLAVELSSAEADALVRNLPDYCAYTEKNPKTLLMRIVGIHRLSVFGFSFAVFINPTPLNMPVAPDIYDLHASGLRLAPPEARGHVGAHLLDKDFVNDRRTVFLSYRDKKRTLLALAQDAAFASSMGVG